MGKTPKKPVSGGDESNLYVRRLKATTTASLNACVTNLPTRQHDSENPNRGKALGAQKRLPAPPGKVFKSKLRIPATTKSHSAMKNPPRFQSSTSKDEKKTTTGPSTTSKGGETSQVPTMQQESEEAAVQLRVSITKKDVKDGGRIAGGGETSAKVEKKASQEDHANSNGKDVIALTETENPTPRDDVAKEGNDAPDKNATADKQKTEEEKTAENGNESTDIIKNNSKHEESECENRSSEFEDNALKLEDEGETPKPSERHVDTEEMTTNGDQHKNATDIKETVQDEELKKSADNCSVDVVESTTSENLDSGNATQESGAHPSQNNPENDASFISYDSSIMLKDVQIKLNDCLKDNSKLFDVSNVNEECSAADDDADPKKRLDMSFGKTLRNISGRSTINRLRYVTVREHRFSPNSSLFVNTSSASLDPEELASCKMTRCPSELSATVLINANPADRKRKIVTESVASVKKLKTETPERTSIFNTSLDLFKSIRRPVQVSTPNTKGYNLSTDKNFGDDKLTVDAEIEPKKWCVVM